MVRLGQVNTPCVYTCIFYVLLFANIIQNASHHDNVCTVHTVK